MKEYRLIFIKDDGYTNIIEIMSTRIPRKDENIIIHNSLYKILQINLDYSKQTPILDVYIEVEKFYKTDWD